MNPIQCDVTGAAGGKMRMCGSADVVTGNLRMTVAGKIAGVTGNCGWIQNCGYYVDRKYCVSSA